MLLSDLKAPAPSARDPQAIRALAVEITRVGNNVNQLAKIANETRALPHERQLREVATLIKATLEKVTSVIPNIVKGRGITGALAYVMGQGKDENGKRIELVPGEKSRAEILGAQNIGFEIESAADLDLARRMMEWNGKEENQASKWRKCEKDCLHASLSWEPGQNPTREEMIAAAQGFLKELGMETAQAIFVAHDDTAHKHLHIVASRIDPLTGKTFSQADDFTKAQAWGLYYEREHGQIPQNESRRALHRIVDAIEARDGAGVVEALTERVPTFTARELDKALSYGRLSKEERATFRDEILASDQRHRLARDGATRR